MKKNSFSFHVDLDAFTPASQEDKAYMVQMRPSSTFFKDGVKRLLKNKVATVSFIIVVFIFLISNYLFTVKISLNAYLPPRFKKIGRCRGLRTHRLLRAVRCASPARPRFLFP